MAYSRIPPEELAKRIDHAVVRPSATLKDVEAGCLEAKRYRLRAICVPPCYVERAAELLKGSGVRVCAVVGFPSGYDLPAVKAREAKIVMELGAQDVDMVMNISALKSGLYDLVLRDIAGVVEAVKAREGVVKVIIEVCYLTEEEIHRACELVLRAGADFVKTSTGLGPSGATIEAVKLIRSVVGDKAGVKASGGIRTLGQALAMLEAGADLIGTSTPSAIIEEALKARRG